MEPLLQTLLSQHRCIWELSNELNLALADSDARTARETVVRLGDALLLHLRLEDEQLYPEMVAAALEPLDLRSAELVREFRVSMVSVSRALTTFFARHAEGRPDLELLRSDWPPVAALLQARFDAEERALYPLYQHLARLRALEPSSLLGCAG